MEITDELTLVKLALQETRNDSYFSEIYKLHFKSIESYILKNNGNADDAKDIFQEVMIIFLKRLKQPEFSLTSSLNTYLFAIARNLWLNKLKKQTKVSHIEIIEDLPEKMYEDSDPEREKKLYNWISRITKHCQQIIRSIFFLKEPMFNLSVRMGWKNQHTAQNQKYKCLKQIKKIKEQENRLNLF